MPSTYAHYRMGQEVRKRLPESIRKNIDQYPELYNIGLHGPDLLFYYNALTKNSVNAAGYALHKQPGSFFFQRAAKVIKEHNMEPAYLSYVYGYLCHFALDVSCHGFVDGQVADTGVGHLALESDLDRRFLLMDGKEPLSTRVTGHLIPGDHTADVIKDFHPEISKEEAYKSIKDMVFYLNALISPGKIKRGLLVGAMKLVGQYESLGGLLIRKEENPAAAPSVEKLLKLYEKGRELAVRLIEEYEVYLKGGKELDPIYGTNFESIKCC
ncbi:MAG: zinc dependent phospholipase C family protein [Lachnospiraceae bacterium]|nr:zinc dependent phospholipase C family protein [Lachnospiraceae bacterium]